MPLGPPIYATNRFEKVVAINGSAAYLNCPIVGSPQLDFTWKRFNVFTSTLSKYSQLSNGSLVIPRTVYSDRGMYTCIAQNQYGILTQEVELVVEGILVQSCICGCSVYCLNMAVAAPTDHPLTERFAVQGRPFKLKCPISAFPEPVIEWSKHSDLSDTSGQILSGSSNAKLKFESVVESDGGLYKCFATNYLGSGTAWMKVILHGEKLVSLIFCFIK